MDIYAVACKANLKKEMKNMNLGIDVGKRKCRAALKDDKGTILDEFFFGNNRSGIRSLLSSALLHDSLFPNIFEACS